jgi:hypothetical protein
MATYLGGVLNKAGKGKELEAENGFEWHNRGSMVFLGTFRVGPFLGVLLGLDADTDR